MMKVARVYAGAQARQMRPYAVNADPGEERIAMVDVGFIGLGDQGGPMAEAILDSEHSLHLWARRPDVLTPYVAQGAIAHDAVASLCASVQHLGICVVGEEDVRELLYVRGGLAAMSRGSMIALHSTISPDACRAIARDAALRGVRVIDAPVSGGRVAAQGRQLLVLAGGDAADIEEAEAVFRSYAARVARLGPIGSGQTAKVLNNLLLNANLATSHFVLGYGKKLGIDRAELRSVLLDGTATSLALDWIDNLVIPGKHSAALGKKDIALALGLDETVPDIVESIANLALSGREAIEKG